jgi:hypothetical protein
MTAMRELIARICEGTKSIWFDPAHACKFHRADLILGVSAQNANVGLSSAYNPYPPGILPLNLNSEIFRVLPSSTCGQTGKGAAGGTEGMVEGRR